MEKSIFNEFRLRMLEQNLNIYGIIVKQNQQKIQLKFRSDDKVNIYSASKGVTSLAIGMLQDAGLLQLDDKILDYFPAYQKDAAPGTEEITIRDLLHMQSGKHNFFDFKTRKGDKLEAFFKYSLDFHPGFHFSYSNGCTYMLSRLVEKLTGETLRDFLVPRLFDPLEIENPQWFTCIDGHTLGATGLFLTTEELSRIGDLYLQEGTYQGKRLVSADYIKASYEDKITTHDPKATPNGREYGYQVWIGQDLESYRLDGKYGQYAIVFPKVGATVTITAHEEFRSSEIVKAVYEDILPHLEANHLK